MSFAQILQTIASILVVSGIVFFLTSSLKRLCEVTGGLLVLTTFNVFFDLGLWPIIQALFGVYGVIGLTLTALVLNFTILHLYQKYSQTDWLGITAVDDLILKSQAFKQSYQSGSKLKKCLIALPTLLLWLSEKAVSGKWIPLLTLAIFTDSFVTTAFHLHRKNGSVNAPMQKTDKIVFCFSTVISCIGWAVLTEWVTIPAFKTVWQTVF